MKKILQQLSFVVLILAAISAHAATGDVIAREKIGGYDQYLTGYEYPYRVEYFKFSSQGQSLKMAFMYLPAKQVDMPVVVLMHGKNFNGAYWKTTAEWLQNQGYGVLIPDQIGFGKSSKPVDYQYSFSALAKNTRNMMASLGIDKAIITAHSMGGMVGTRFALNYPDATEKLVLINPIGLENYLRYTEYKDVNFFYHSAKQLTAEKIIAYQKKNYYDGDWNSDYEALTVPLVGMINGPDNDQLAYVSALTYDMIFTQPVIEEFHYLQVPTQLILGTRDRTGPGRNWKRSKVDYELGRYDLLGAKVRQLNPEVRITELEAVGHLPHIEAFNRFILAYKKSLIK